MAALGKEAALQLREQRIMALRSQLEAFFPQGGTVTLEIGCGHGHWLTGYAQGQPWRQFLGVDLVSKRVDRAQRKPAKLGLSNVRFLKAEAMELLEAWPQGLAIEEIALLFPDPWPKKRHWKNRLLQPSLLTELRRLAVEHCPLFVRSDDAAYLEWAGERIDEHPGWARTPVPWPYELQTFFQSFASSYAEVTARAVG